MQLTDILSFVIGIALFLFGMHTMSTGMEKIAGGKLERILEKLSNNLFKAVGLGIVATVLMQSSSATTIMVVGFVNSGMMNLSQAVGIIMGANIGTTVTAWILSLTGLESAGGLLTLLSPTGLAPLLALLGVVLLMFAKRDKSRDIGGIFMGLGILLFGMTTMSSAVAPLTADPAFQNILTLFNNPLFGVLAGTVVTLIVQSSAASVGILQAVALNSTMTYGMAMPIIMGQNIGTCVHSLTSSIGANKNAKRAAMVHLYFNLIGTVLFLVLFYLGDYIFHFSFTSLQVDAAGIALIHSVFNIATTVILLPFAKLLEKLAILSVPEKSSGEGVALLEDRFLSTPSVAAQRASQVTEEMAAVVEKNLLRAFDCLEAYTEKKEDSIRKHENEIDDYEDRLGTYLVRLSRNGLSDKDSQRVSKLLHSITDLERIGDHALNLTKSAREMHEKELSFSPVAQAELQVLVAAEKEIIHTAVAAFCADDVALASRVEPLEQVIDQLTSDIRDRHIGRLKDGSCTIEMGFVLSDILINLERVGDHCSNIAVSVIRIDDNAFDTHSYLAAVKAESTAFEDIYEEYNERFSLPTA